MGFEIDGEEAFEKQIDGFSDAFVEILKDELEFLKDHLKEAAAIAKKLVEAGWAGAIAAAIAVGVVLAINVFVALWAPADLIIEDSIGPTTFDLVQFDERELPAAVAERAHHARRHQGEGHSARKNPAAVSRAARIHQRRRG